MLPDLSILLREFAQRPVVDGAEQGSERTAPPRDELPDLFTMIWRACLPSHRLIR